MKARPVPTRKQIERVAEQCSHEIIECLQDENAISLIATMRFFGLGKKRARDYLNFLADVKAEFGRYGKEGILKIDVVYLVDGMELCYECLENYVMVDYKSDVFGELFEYIRDMFDIEEVEND